MTKTSKIILVTIIATMILLGLGYAAIQNITLTIAGTAAADPSQSNFIVKFTGTPTVSSLTNVAAAITDDINATINVTGLTEKGQIATATYDIENSSIDLSADLGLTLTNSNTEFFSIKSDLAKTSLKAGESTTVTVTVELLKTPIDGSEESTIGIQITAAPVQPGEEGSSGISSDLTDEPTENIVTDPVENTI